MDPVSLAVTLLAVYAILQRAPGLLGEAVREWGYARRGEESPTAADRRQRLVEAGLEPAATGGPMRRFLGNVWRDVWRDLGARRQDNRVDRDAQQAGAEAAKSWRHRFDDRIDAEVTRHADRWRAEPTKRTDVPDERPPAPSGGTPSAARPTVPESPGAQPGPDVTDEDELISVIHESDEYSFREPPTPPPPPPPRGPLRVDVTVGDPIRDPNPAPTAPAAAITAGGTMTVVATTQQQVTGVVSGAAEARAIQRQVDAATEAYVAQLAQIRKRIHALGEQTLSTVQLAARSKVVAYTAAAAESAAAAQATARSCSAEVGPLLGNVAREFNRLNS